MNRAGGRRLLLSHPAQRGGKAHRLVRRTSETCAANEAWINAQMQRGAHIIDIGIDDSRQGSRSPYYTLELREMAEAGYPAERRPWPASAAAYTPPNPGPCP